MFLHRQIRNRRIELRLTLEALAKILLLKSPSEISLWERGRRTPNARSLEKLAHALGVPVSFFYGPLDCVPRTHITSRTITRRQRQVLHGLAAGLTHRELAVRLHVSTRTIDFHHRHLNRVFGVSNVVLLLRESVRSQVLPENVLCIPASTLLQSISETDG